MLGLKGRNEVWEHSFRILISPHQWFCTKTRTWEWCCFLLWLWASPNCLSFFWQHVQLFFSVLVAWTANTPGSCCAAKCLINTCNWAHNSSICGSSSSVPKPSMFQPAPSPVVLTRGEWCPSRRDRYCWQKFPLCLWLPFQQLIPLNLTNEGRIFLGHGRRFPCWHYPIINCLFPRINRDNQVEQAILFILHVSKMSLRKEVHFSVFLLLS